MGRIRAGAAPLIRGVGRIRADAAPSMRNTSCTRAGAALAPRLAPPHSTACISRPPGCLRQRNECGRDAAR